MSKIASGNLRGRKFQVLIGRLVTLIKNNNQVYKTKFQVLIGRLVTQVGETRAGKPKLSFKSL